MTGELRIERCPATMTEQGLNSEHEPADRNKGRMGIGQMGYVFSPILLVSTFIERRFLNCNDYVVLKERMICELEII
jgi:hypothetical protein